MGDRHIPIIDEDKLDDIITALQALSAPSGTDVAISPTGMHIVTEDDVQGAISELDAKAYEINASLTNLLDNLDFNSEDVIDLTVSNPQYTPTTAGIITGYFRKDTTSANGIAGVTSSKISNNYRYLQTLAGSVSGGYAPINMVVVKGEVLKFASLTGINTASGQSRISFIPFKINS